MNIRKIDKTEVEVLAGLARQTFRETFAHDNTEAQLQEYFEEAYALSVLTAELENPESSTYFIQIEDKLAGYLKVNWGAAQTEQKLANAFEIQRIYILQEFQGQGLGKQVFEFALNKAKVAGFTWVWLGVWEKNFKAQEFYAKYSFEKFSEHHFPVGDKIDTDWLLRKKLN